MTDFAKHPSPKEQRAERARLIHELGWPPESALTERYAATTGELSKWVADMKEWRKNYAARWGFRLDQWQEQQGPLHLLLADGSPACGCKYLTTSGHVRDHEYLAKCGTCVRIAKGKLR